MGGPWQIPRVECFEWVRRLPTGATRPALVTSNWDDVDETVYLKFRRPGRIRGNFGPVSLACELVHATLARRLGLPTPKFGIVDVPAWLAFDQADSAARDILAVNTGPNFGTVAVRGAVTFRRTKRGDVDLQELTDLLAFDVALHNKDRTVDHPNLLVRESKIFLIDHGYCPPLDTLAKGADRSRIWMTGPESREHVARGLVRRANVDAAALLHRWDESVTADSLNSLRSEIPSEWDEPAGTLDHLFAFLGDRKNLFRSTLCRVIENALK